MTQEHAAFGVVLHSPLALPGTWRAAPAGPAVELRCVAPGEATAACGGELAPGWSGVVDGAPFVVERGQGGELLMRQEGVSAFHLSADGAVLQMELEGEPSTGALRTLLDSVLFTVALAHGREALHGAGVELDGGVVAILGDAGAGKSTLAAALRARGAAFFTDDILVLGEQDGETMAFPGPPVATLPVVAPADGPVIAELPGERWVAQTGATAPRPVRGVVLLGGDEPAAPASTLLAVLRHALPFPAERQQARFDVVADVVERARVIPMQARAAPADVMADRILAALRQERRP